MGKLILPRRKFLLAGVGLLAAPAIVRAGSLSLLGVGKPAAGGSITQTAIFGVASSAQATTQTFNGLTLGTGDVLVGIYTSTGFTPSTVTVGGVTASLLSGTTDPSAKRSFWLATGVNTATGTVFVNTVASDDCCVMGWLLTGENPASAAVTSNLSGAVADPQSITFTVPSNGVGFIFVGSNGTSTANPVTWTVASRDAVTESAASGGTGAVAGGAHITTVGSVSPTAAGGGGGAYSFTVDSMLAVTFHT